MSMRKYAQKALGYSIIALMAAGTFAVVNWMEQENMRQERFVAAFGIEVPIMAEERAVAFPIVQQQVGKLEMEARDAEMLAEADEDGRSAANAAVRRHLNAWELAMDYKLTEGDQIVEALDRSREWIERWTAYARGFNRQTGAEILREYSRKKS